jgi:hypothetical protein
MISALLRRRQGLGEPPVGAPGVPAIPRSRSYSIAPTESADDRKACRAGHRDLQGGRRQSQSSILDLTSEDFDGTIKTNIYAPFWIIKGGSPAPEARLVHHRYNLGTGQRSVVGSVRLRANKGGDNELRQVAREAARWARNSSHCSGPGSHLDAAAKSAAALHQPSTSISTARLYWGGRDSPQSNLRRTTPALPLETCAALAVDRGRPEPLVARRREQRSATIANGRKK